MPGNVKVAYRLQWLGRGKTHQIHSSNLYAQKEKNSLQQSPNGGLSVVT